MSQKKAIKDKCLNNKRECRVYFDQSDVPNCYEDGVLGFPTYLMKRNDWIKPQYDCVVTVDTNFFCQAKKRY